MYHLLAAHAPHGWKVLTQVSMGQLLTAHGGDARQNLAHWRRVSQLACDFVLCDSALAVIGVVELDDHTHRGKEHKDARRDAWLAEAGIATQRFYHVPAAEQVAAMFARWSDRAPAQADGERCPSAAA